MTHPRPPDPQWHDALTGWARPWRWVISGMAGLAASGCMLIVVALSVLLLAYSPINNGDYVSPDDRQLFLDLVPLVPGTIEAAAAVTAIALAALWLLVHVAARVAPRAPTTAYSDYLAQIRRDPLLAEQPNSRRPHPVGKQRSGPGRRWARRATWTVVVLAASWAVGSFVLDRPLLPRTVGDYAWGILAIVVGAVLAGVGILIAAILLAALWGLSSFFVSMFEGPLRLTGTELAAFEAIRAREARIQHRDAEAAERAALERWPPPCGPPLRLHAAAVVLAAGGPARRPPGSRVGRGRALRVGWSKRRTSVEALAAYLLATAILECRQRGFLTVETAGGHHHLAASLPADRMPEGLASIVLGRPRVGRTQGRVVDGTLRQMIGSWLPDGSEDPHWSVIEVALEDVAAAGARRPDGSIDLQRLHEVAGAAPQCLLEGSTLADRQSRLLVEVDRALRKQRTAVMGPGTIGLVIGYVVEKSRRTGRWLPDGR